MVSQLLRELKGPLPSTIEGTIGASQQGRNSDRRALGAGGQIFLPGGGWVSGRVIERLVRRSLSVARPRVDESAGHPPLTERQSLHRPPGSSGHVSGSALLLVRLVENVRGIAVKPHPVIL